MVDNFGRVHLYTISGGNGKMHVVANDTVTANDQLNELDTVVGLHWLPQYPLDCRVSCPLVQHAQRLTALVDVHWTS